MTTDTRTGTARHQHPFFGLPPARRLHTPGDARDMLHAQVTALTEARGRLSECTDIAAVRALLNSMIDERRDDARHADRLEQERLGSPS